jgi:hypothetical protein
MTPSTTITTATTTTTTTITPSKPRIRVLSPNRYLVESQSQPGIGRQVDTLHLRCSCPAGQYRRRCRHLILALAYDEWRRRQRAAAEAQQRPVETGMAALQAAF